MTMIHNIYCNWAETNKFELQSSSKMRTCSIIAHLPFFFNVPQSASFAQQCCTNSSWLNHICTDQLHHKVHISSYTTF